jgi:hypothetical protein
MIAIVGLPGSRHHQWKHGSSRRSLRAWAEETRATILRRNPGLGTLPIEIVSDRVALRRRWRDGNPIYSKEALWAGWRWWR